MKPATRPAVPVADLTLDAIVELLAIRVAAKVLSGQADGVARVTVYTSKKPPPGMSVKRFNERCRELSKRGDAGVRKIGRVWTADGEAFETRARSRAGAPRPSGTWSVDAALESSGVRFTRWGGWRSSADGRSARRQRNQTMVNATKVSKGGRPAKGSPVWRHEALWVRVTLKDGSRPFIALDPTIPREDEARARACAAEVSDAARRSGAVSAKTALMATWFSDWIGARRSRGHTSVREDDSHYRVHIKVVIGDKPIRDWTADDLRALSRNLDAKVASGAMSSKTATNVWGTATKMCSDSVRSKIDALRVRRDDPSTSVEGPTRGPSKAKQYLYPSAFQRFVACEDVPLLWRQLVALMVYPVPPAGRVPRASVR